MLLESLFLIKVLLPLKYLHSSYKRNHQNYYIDFLVLLIRVEYCAMLCTEFNLDPLGKNVIIDHATAHKLGWGNNHGDVAHWWPKYHGVYLDDLRNDVAKKMGIETKAIPYKVQVGAFMRKDFAERMKQKLEDAGFETYIVTVDNLYKVQVGAFNIKANADAMLKKLSGAGYKGFITK